ncbi:hypothetical protein [Allosphingosinicella sp.]|uniref:hypothetical protein n=1 Tax=Allosphingosinicella sp. TaxID=2823234 RepID=UPI002EE5EAEA
MPPLATTAPPPPADPVEPPPPGACRGTVDGRGRCGPVAAAAVERTIEWGTVSLGPLRLQWAERVSVEASVSPSGSGDFRIPLRGNLLFTLVAPNGDVRILTDAALHSERTGNPDRPFSGIRWQVRPDGTGSRQLALRVDSVGSGPPERLGEHIFTLDVASPPAGAAQPPGPQVAQPPAGAKPPLPAFAQTLWDWVRGPIGIISLLLVAITAFSTKLRDMFKSLRETREEFAKLKGSAAGGEPGKPSG